MSTLEQIKSLREQTGAGVVDVKKALDEAGGDQEKARELLKKKGQDKALKKSDREAHEGTIGVYVHSNGKIAAMVQILCETDFVARNDEFVELAKDVAMHIAAMNPLCLRPEDVDGQMVEKEKEVWSDQLAQEGKPQEMHEKIMQGKEKKFREEVALLTQSFVKNPDQTIQELLTEKVSKIGENVQIGEFKRMEL